MAPPSKKKMRTTLGTGVTLSTPVSKKKMRPCGAGDLLRKSARDKMQQVLRAERSKGKKQLDVTIDFNSLPPLYQQVPSVCNMRNIDGDVGGISPHFRSALFYVDPSPPMASVFKDYAGQFGKAVLEVKNAVLVFCTKEKANHFCDRVHLNPDKPGGSYFMTFAGNPTEDKRGAYDVFDKKPILLFVRMLGTESFTFYGQVTNRKDNHCPANTNHKDNPTWRFEFMDNNMPSQWSSYLAQVFDIIQKPAKRIRAASSAG